MLPRPLLAAPLLILAAAPACVHDKSVPEDNGRLKSVAELNITDPDPTDRDEQAPPFCNPNGKSGEDLRRCYEHNDMLYKTFEDEAKKREPWFNFASASWLQAKDVDAQFVVAVLKEDEAVKRLETTSVIALTPAEAEKLTGKPLAFAGRQPYLIRALVYYKETGSYSVYEKDQSVLIRHDSIGATNPGEKHSAVVVYLGFKPKEVYVDCQLTE